MGHALARLGWVAILASLPLCVVAAASRPNAPPPSDGADWRGYNNTLDGQRFSLLRQITAANAPAIREICRVSIADYGTFQSGLVAIEGTMYVTTATDTVALDATTCAVRWRQVYGRERHSSYPVNRGVAYLNGRLYRGTDDGQVIALDARTGAEVWRSLIGEVGLGESVAGAPIAWNGLIVAGIAGAEFGVRGRIVALDAVTGRELWHFYTIPLAGETGADSWQDTHWNAHGGGSTWTSFAVDPVADEVFVPVGNPAPDFSPEDRAGSNLFTDSVVVLDGRTGALKWWYQAEPNDAFDYDLGAAPLLYRSRDGEARFAVAGKDGYLYIVDRSTHALLARTAVTTVDTVKHAPSPDGVRVCPGISGGVEWNGPAHDPDRHLLFVGAVDYCAIVHSGPPSQWHYGSMTFGGSWAPTQDPATGWITALDADSGAVKWQYHAPAPVLSGITATAGGIVIAGDNAGHLYIFNSDTGAVLKQVPTGGSLSGGLITYEQAGRQYLAFTSGNISKTVFGAQGRPTVIVMALPASASPKPGDWRPALKPDLLHGHQVYIGLCATCHGADGNSIAVGEGGLAGIRQRLSVDQLTAWIRNPQPPMPKVFPEPLLGAESEDLRDLAAYILAWPTP